MREGWRRGMTGGAEGGGVGAVVFNRNDGESIEK